MIRAFLYFTKFCYVYILDPCRGVDCGSGLKCEPAGRSYSCLGKAKFLFSKKRKFNHIRDMIEFGYFTMLFCRGRLIIYKASANRCTAQQFFSVTFFLPLLF